MSAKIKPFLLPLLLVVIAAVVWFGPAEQELGSNVRIVYLHGAWVWTALIGFAAAAISGAVGLAMRRHRWLARSKAFGQSATLFWVTYLPISLWAMQTNWNGLYLLEPRWRIGLDFALVALLLQAAVLITRSAYLTGLVNLGFAASLFWALSQAEQVMHPPSPISSSPSALIQSYFLLLVIICLLAGWLISQILLRRQART